MRKQTSALIIKNRSKSYFYRSLLLYFVLAGSLFAFSCQDLIDEDILNANFELLREDSYGILKTTDIATIAAVAHERMKKLTRVQDDSFKYSTAECDTEFDVTIEKGINPDLIRSFPYTITIDLNAACPLNQGTFNLVYLSNKDFRMLSSDDYRLLEKRSYIEVTLNDFGFHFLNKNYSYNGTFVYSYVYSVLNVLSYQGDFSLYIYPNGTDNDLSDDTVQVKVLGVGQNKREETISLSSTETDVLEKPYSSHFFTKGTLIEKIAQRDYVNTIDYSQSTEERAEYTVDKTQRAEYIRPDL